MARRVLHRDKPRDNNRDSNGVAPTILSRYGSVTGQPSGTAAALLAAAERGAAAGAAGPADALDRAEADAILALAEAPAPKPPAAHLAHVQALARAALLRPPSWPDPKAIPSPGCRCSCCGGNRWWREAEAPQGWRCAACHPPDHLAPELVREARS